MKTQLLFDLESTGLLRRGSTLHCMVMRDALDSSTHIFDHQPDRSIIQGVKKLEGADLLIGHNIIGFDIPLLKEQFPNFHPKGQVMDTLVLSRLFYPHIEDRDYERRPHGMPQRMYGRHSLEAWGHRLHEYKGEFGKTTDWSDWSPEMEAYCCQDVKVTTKVCDHFHPYLTGSR